LAFITSETELEMVPVGAARLDQDAYSAQLQHRLETEGATVKEVDVDRVLLVMADGKEIWVEKQFLQMATKQ
jgi:hypothetical protein